MGVVWGLLVLLVGGLMFALLNVGSGEAQPQKPRRAVAKKVVKKAPATQPAEEEAKDVAPEPPTLVEETEEQPESEPAEEPLIVAEPPLDDRPADVPSVDQPEEEAPTEDEDDEKEDRRRRLSRTDEDGNYYIDMATGTLLFTPDSALNDENLEIYLDSIMDTYATQEYDQEGAERTDEEKQVK